MEQESNSIRNLKQVLDTDQVLKKLVEYSLNNTVDAVAEHLLVMNDEFLKKLIRLTRSTELRWVNVLKGLRIRCPECGGVLKGDCAKFKCYTCEEQLMVRSEVLHDICKRCKAYNNKQEDPCYGPFKEELQEPIIVRLPYFMRKNNE